MATKRVDVTLDSDLLDRLDAFAKRINLNRSAALAAILTATLDGETLEVLRIKSPDEDEVMDGVLSTCQTGSD